MGLEQVTKDTRSSPEAALVDKNAVDSLAQSGGDGNPFAGGGCRREDYDDELNEDLTSCWEQNEQEEDTKKCGLAASCKFLLRVPRCSGESAKTLCVAAPVGASAALPEPTKNAVE